MIVGICEVDLYLYQPNSLKEKRSIVKSIIERSKHKFNISIAEVGDNDKWQLAKIGFATVSNNSRLVGETIDKVIDFISSYTEVEITNIQTEIN